MIRIFYWLIVLLEILLLLVTLLLFIVTDSRTVTFLARQALSSTDFTYKSIDGNLFEGLSIRELAYNNHSLFHKATLHWNPITLLNHKVSFTKVEVEGLELDSIVKMAGELGSDKSRSNKFSLDYMFSLRNIHVDINPYVYEGVKFSDFVSEIDEVDISKDLTIDSEGITLAFKSDLANVKLKGKIKENRLLLDNLSIKEISTVAIPKFIKRVTKKSKSSRKTVVKRDSNRVFIPFKEIRIRSGLATLKSVRYGDFKLYSLFLRFKNGVIDPYRNYEYSIKKLSVRGETNFLNIDYKGSVKKSTIYAKGDIRLKKRLFKKYKLPLNFKGLEKLPTHLKLNHHGVWLKVDHRLKKLLKRDNFNIDIKKAHHEIAYIYGKNLEVKSNIEGSNSYAKKMNLNVNTIVNFKKRETTYEGDVQLEGLLKVPDIVKSYLLPKIEGKFKGDLKGLKVGVNSELLRGDLELKGYQSLKVNLASKKRNIRLGKLFPSIDKSYKNQLLDLNATAFFPFKKIEKSKISVDIGSSLLDISAKTGLKTPYIVDFKLHLPSDSKFRDVDRNIKFSRLSNLFGKAILVNNHLEVKVDNRENFNAEVEYDIKRSQLLKAEVFLDELPIYLSSSPTGNIHIETHIRNLQKSFKSIAQYYSFEVPTIQGGVDIDVTQNSKKEFLCHLKSKNIKYLSDKGVNLSVFNIYDIETNFTIDSALNIVLKNYHFHIDKNEYLYRFFSKRPSYLSFNNGNLKIKKLWINDTILIKGDYALEKARGELNIEVNPYHFINKNLDLLFNVNLKAKILNNKFDVSGNVDILGNSINYELPTAGIIEDSDIVIVQEMLKNREAPFQNLKLYLKINSSKPLLYRGEGVEVSFVNDISIVKNYKQHMLVTGMSTIKDGYYDLEDKHFTLDESYLYFAGDARKPLLDIKANYVKEQYTIHIFISGTADEPIVNFNSDPYLTQQEILSLILFDETGIGGKGKGAEAYTLLGGTIAKELMKSLGINIDHFVVGTDENDQLSLEVGSKISKNISLIYLNREGLDGVKVRVEHSKHLETDIIIMPPNTSSIEFLYKSDH